MSPTSELPLDDLVDYCKDRVGDGLRHVAVVEGDDVTSAYFREQVEQRYSRAKMAELSEAFRTISDEFDDLYTYQTPLGQTEAVVCSFQRAHVFLLPISDDRTVLVSVDRDVAGSLSKFIEQCSNQLYRH